VSLFTPFKPLIIDRKEPITNNNNNKDNNNNNNGNPVRKDSAMGGGETSYFLFLIIYILELSYQKRKNAVVNPSQFIYASVGDASAVRKYNEKDLLGKVI
jgi:hypothetical protein